MTATWFRQADPRFPFLHYDPAQLPGRWHALGSGPAQYFADTPDGAWAEFLRHEEIIDAIDLAGVERDLWAVEIPVDAETIAQPSNLSPGTVRGAESTYVACQAEAARVRGLGATALMAPSAGLRDDSAGGESCDSGSLRQNAGARDGTTLVLFGERSDLAGWRCCHRGRPEARLIDLVRTL